MRKRTAPLIAAWTAFAGGCTGDGDDREAKPGRVDVMVQAEGAPQVGGLVFAHDGHGEVIDEEITDQDGKVSFALVPAGGMISALHVEVGGVPNLRTVRVEPGDDLLFVFSPANESFQIATVDVQMPAFPGAAGYDVRTPCNGISGTGTTYELDIQRSCTDVSDLTDFVVFAEDGDGTAIAFSVQEDVDVVTTNQIVMPAWRTDFVSAPASIEGVGDEVTAVFGILNIVDDGRGIELFESSTLVSDGAGTVPMFALPDFGDEAVRVVAEIFEDGEEGAAVYRVERAPLPLTAVSFDAGDFLPPLLGVVVDTAGGSARPTVRWDEVSMSDVDLFRVTMNWRGSDRDLDWDFTVHGSDVANGELRFPAVPAALAGVVPTGGSLQVLASSFRSASADLDLLHLAAGDFDFDVDDFPSGAFSQNVSE